jgi:probable phosphoglycerate mutase
MNLRTLYLVRHGQTDWSKKGLFCGRTNVQLNTEGMRQAKALSQALPSPEKARSFCSPLSRAFDTARLAGYEPEVTDMLLEIDLGELEGEHSAMYRDAHPGWSLFSDGAPSGEPPAEFRGRLERTLNFVRAQLEFSDVVLFSHGQAVKALLSLLVTQDLSLADRLKVGEAAVCQLEMRGEDRLRLVFE